MNFATRFSVRLFDEEMQLTHNVAGRGKPKLDPKIISFIKCKCFEIFPCSVSESVASKCDRVRENQPCQCIKIAQFFQVCIVVANFHYSSDNKN